MLRVPRPAFERLVQDALSDLPEEFATLLDNVIVVVEEEPSAEDLKEVGLEDGDELFGLYHGTSLLERGAGHMGLPDRVVIYRGPILRCCDSWDEAVKEVTETVIHEIGHHMGLDDDEMVF